MIQLVDSDAESCRVQMSRYSELSAVMVSCVVLILGPLWIQSLVQACDLEELPRGVVLSWFKERVLEGLGLEKPPLTRVQGPDGDAGQRHTRVPRTRRAAWENRQTSSDQDTSQMILFPTSGDSAMNQSTCSYFTFNFQPSINLQHAAVTSADFWVHVEGANSSTSLSISSAQQLLLAPQTPTKLSSDGWSTFHLDGRLLTSVVQGPFQLQIRCPACRCRTNDPDQTPFLHLHVQRPRGHVRLPREAAVTIPWSPAAIYRLQRPSQERPQQEDCTREEIEISFEELGWDNWIVHPEVLTFYYCHGNCSAGDRMTAVLGISQCCAPVPGTMKSLKITTTSDGGYSFKYETLPNIMPEECTCI